MTEEADICMQDQYWADDDIHGQASLAACSNVLTTLTVDFIDYMISISHVHVY